MIIPFGFVFGSFLGIIGFGWSTWQYWVICLFFLGGYSIGRRDGSNE